MARRRRKKAKKPVNPPSAVAVGDSATVTDTATVPASDESQVSTPVIDCDNNQDDDSDDEFIIRATAADNSYIKLEPVDIQNVDPGAGKQKPGRSQSGSVAEESTLSGQAGAEVKPEDLPKPEAIIETNPVSTTKDSEVKADEEALKIEKHEVVISMECEVGSIDSVCQLKIINVVSQAPKEDFDSLTDGSNSSGYLEAEQVDKDNEITTVNHEVKQNCNGLDTSVSSAVERNVDDSFQEISEDACCEINVSSGNSGESDCEIMETREDNVERVQESEQEHEVFEIKDDDVGELCEVVSCDSDDGDEVEEVKMEADCEVELEVLDDPSATAKSRFTCEPCEGFFRDAKSYNEHCLKYHGSGDKVVKAIYTCKLCHECFTDTNSYHNHCSYAHRTDQEEFPHMCTVCDIPFLSVLSLHLHFNQDHASDKTPFFRCVPCSEVFRSLLEFENHRKAAMHKTIGKGTHYVYFYFDMQKMRRNSKRKEEVLTYWASKKTCDASQNEAVRSISPSLTNGDSNASVPHSHMINHYLHTHECPLCQEKLTLLNKLPGHLAHRHVGVRSISYGCLAADRGKYVCTTDSQHVNPSPFQCALCFAGFWKASNMLEHLRQTHLLMVDAVPAMANHVTLSNMVTMHDRHFQPVTTNGTSNRVVLVPKRNMVRTLNSTTTTVASVLNRTVTLTNGVAGKRAVTPKKVVTRNKTVTPTKVVNRTVTPTKVIVSNRSAIPSMCVHNRPVTPNAGVVPNGRVTPTKTLSINRIVMTNAGVVPNRAVTPTKTHVTDNRAVTPTKTMTDNRAVMTSNVVDQNRSLTPTAIGTPVRSMTPTPAEVTTQNRVAKSSSSTMPRIVLKAARKTRTTTKLPPLKRHACDQCPLSFINWCDLRLHKRKHSGARPYKCKYCDLRFISYTTLATHQSESHRGQEPYRCGECARAFASAGALRIHSQVHACQKPFTCDHCGKRFVRRDLLRQHVEREHATDEHRCQAGNVRKTLTMV